MRILEQPDPSLVAEKRGVKREQGQIKTKQILAYQCLSGIIVMVNNSQINKEMHE